MDLGKPTDEDKSLVKNNQSASDNFSAPLNQNNPIDQPKTPPTSPLAQNIPVNPPNSSMPTSPKTVPDSTNSFQTNVPPPITPVKEEPSKNDIGVGRPNIGVELEESPSSKTPTTESPIELNTSETKPTLGDTQANITAPAKNVEAPTPANPDGSVDIPINRPPATPEPSQNIEPPPTTPPPTAPPASIPPSVPTPPIKASPSNAGVLIVILAIFALAAGGLGGFFGFQYLNRLKSSASELGTSPTPTSTVSSANTNTTYTSAKYNFSIQYLSSWFINTTSTQADSIILASNQASLEGTPTGYKVSIDFQSNDGKTLQAWVDSNKVTSGETNNPTQITVSGSPAYQEVLTKNGPAIATYVPLTDQIMIVTYTAPASLYDNGTSLYNQIISSIKVTQ